MDALTHMALVGTARQGEPSAGSGTLVDGVLAALTDVPMERRVLLAAGARAAATMAGTRASRSEAAPAPAPAETRAACSAKAARILGDLLHGHHPELLPEAFALLARAKQRVPFPLLPDALRLRGDELRAAVRPALGERGAWLARLNEAWSWATAPPAAATWEEHERAWTDGTPAARRELLARARAIDPPRARAWLEATWSSEKADERAALLAGLRTGLSADDEPFLEAQLRDRAATVRESAQAVLPYLPESAFVKRMTGRADAMLDVKPSALSFLGKRGALTVSPPEAVDDAAERDGLTKPPAGVGARAFWLSRAVAAVPVAHWTERFGRGPADLVAAAEATDWASALGEGWARAALRSGDAAWLAALWDFFQRADEKSVTPALASTMAVAILQRMTPADAATRAFALFGPGPSRVNVATALAALPRPWPAGIGMRWLEGVRREIQGLVAPMPLLATVAMAALALPAECFVRALEPIDLAEGNAPAWERALAQLSEVIRIRHDLALEIAP